MAETQWYYSDQGQERGPVSTSALKELAASGRLKSSDLIWREGMDDWSPASQVKGLWDGAAATEAQGRPRLLSVSSSRDFSTALGSLRRFAQPLLMIGIVVVVAARGCDALGTRNVARLKTKHAAAQQTFADGWDLRQKNIERQITELRGEETRSERQENQLQELTDELTKLPDLKAEEQKELEADWHELEITGRNAESNNTMNAYWREWFFMLGSIALVIGLLGVGFTGQGAERWICLIMLAIITFSLYVWPG